VARATLAVLVPRPGDDPAPPESRPLGRIALALEREDIDLVFAFWARHGRVTGVRARPGRWEPAPFEFVWAAYDRYPSRGERDLHQALLAGLRGVPVVNDPEAVRLCRDKVATQHRIEAHVPMPEVETDPARFADRLRDWGAGFLKPRFGSFGDGISRVVPGDPLPAEILGDPPILQRALAPPEGWAGWSVRVLVQREVDGRWIGGHPVVRRSRTDPVVNAARGAEVAALEDLRPVREVVQVALDAAQALVGDDPLVVELGVDVVLDRELRPWVVEVNGTPRGRLEVLAAGDPRWAPAHFEAAARPLRYLAARV
jgi:glutathione synthase/RimK-type ligase-like ATP-grasp enzyme